MVKVAIWGSLRAATDDLAEIEVEAATLREMIEAIAERFPAARPQLDRGVSVVIDGRVHTDDWFAPIDDRNEVVLLPKITGG